MIALCTGHPRVEARGQSIVVAFPSGRDTLEISLELDEALRLRQQVTQATNEALSSGFAAPPPEGQIIAFRRTGEA